MPSKAARTPRKKKTHVATKPRGEKRSTPLDLTSKNGFLTDVWGPSLWLVLHTISMNYPCQPTAKQRTAYKKFFDSLQHVLPCGKCRDNLCNNLRCTNYGPHVFNNRETLSHWVYTLHACVNKMLGKQTELSYDTLRHTFENFRARCGPSPAAPKYRGGGGKARSHTRKRESGCTQPVTGVRSKCILKIVPKHCAAQTLAIDKRCLCVMTCKKTISSRGLSLPSAPSSS
jgi:FAD-linked sulfhydryl oxidase